jgi:DNA mismatch repair ATPase MutS
MKVSQKDNGDIRFHYKLEQKLEKKKLAIELLRMKSLDKEIIDCALKFYNDTFMKKKKKRKRKKKKNQKELIIIEN